MMLPYAYVPSRDDLWLYEDHTITWTNPTPGSIPAKRAVAWNPGSPLYPYRHSLAGINAKYRFWGTAAQAGQVAAFAQYNDPNNPANNPVYYNSFPPTMNLVSPRFMYGCLHCFNAQANRNPASYYAGGHYAADGFLVACTQFRWISPATNQTLDALTPYEVLKPYNQDTANGINFFGNDLCVFEGTRSVAATPLIVADSRNCDRFTKAWFVDGSTKVIRIQIVRAWVRGQEPYWVLIGVLPDGGAAPVQPGPFTHDSGSFIVVEIDPPTSAEAGDGIAGILPWHIVSSPFNVPVSGYDDISSTGFLATLNPQVPPFRSYVAARGYPMQARRSAWRTGDPATETVQQQILSQVD